MQKGFCYAEIHELLPKEKQEKEFYKDFTLKFMGFLSILVAVGSIGGIQYVMLLSF